MQTKIRWSGRYPNRGVPAKVAWIEVERIRASKGGEVRPADVVAAARSASNPLHPIFDWSDTTAAKRWREQQARWLIAGIEVEIIRNKGDDPEVSRAYINVEGGAADDSRPYVPLATALGSTDMRIQVIDNAMRELEGWKARYARYTALAPLAQQIDAALKSYRRKAT